MTIEIWNTPVAGVASNQIRDNGLRSWGVQRVMLQQHRVADLIVSKYIQFEVLDV